VNYSRSAVTRQIDIPRSFDPAYSVLGRWLRRRSDRLQAEARFYLYSVSLFVGLVFVGYVSWTVLRHLVVGEPSGMLARAISAVPVVTAVAFVALCIVGFRPIVHLRIHHRTIAVEQGGRELKLRIDEIVGAETVAASTYHRVYRRYAGVHEFSRRQAEEFLLLKASHDTLALGLTAEQREEVLSWLQRERAVDPQRLSNPQETN